MPREVILYNPEGTLMPRYKNGYALKLKYEALRRASLRREKRGGGQRLDYEIHKFKSEGELEEQIRDAFASHQTNRIDKLIINAHADIIDNPPYHPEGVIYIKPYSGDMIGQMLHGKHVGDGISVTELSAILSRIHSPTRVPELRLICCNAGLLSVKNNIARTFLRSNLFNYVVAEDMDVSVNYFGSIFKTRMSEREARRAYEPYVPQIPIQNQPNPDTETFLKYCAPGNGFRVTEGSVVFYHYMDPVLNLPVERYERYGQGTLSLLPNISSHLGRAFPPYV